MWKAFLKLLLISERVLYPALAYAGLEQLELQEEFLLQQLHFPLDGISKLRRSRSDSYSDFIYFPNGAASVPTPLRQQSRKALSLESNQYGLFNGSYPWLYDLDQAPMGITIMFYFMLAEIPTGGGFILSARHRKRDSKNAAGFDVQADSTGQLIIRFGYRTSHWVCNCGKASATKGTWHAVHASARNYFGFIQYTMAVDRVRCADADDGSCKNIEMTPNYDGSGINVMYVGTNDPTGGATTAMTIDELRLYNTWLDIPTYGDDSSKCCDIDVRTGDCEIDCPSTSAVEVIQQPAQLAVESSCAPIDMCSLYPCDHDCRHGIGKPPHCTCDRGFNSPNSGVTCYSNCISVTCQLNADCIPNETNFSCVCDKDHTGRICENEVDHCEGVSCRNGKCVSVRGGFQCVCDEKYAGKYCDDLIVDCSLKPCRNGGTCVLANTERGFKCNCAVGWRGLVCQSPYYPCEDKSDPYCSNNGNCTQIRQGLAYCTCNKTHTGARCDTPLNPCDPQPCLNGGTCLTMDRNFVCRCPAGLTGINCEEDVDECLLDPVQVGDPPHKCNENQYCVNLFGDAYCACRDETMKPPECTEPTNPCLVAAMVSVCVNGECEPDPVTGYRCKCYPGYVGDRCEHKAADRCTVFASAERVVAGEPVTYVVQCVDLGDEPRFDFNMGDRSYFSAPAFRKVPQAAEHILRKFNVAVTLQVPPERYVYAYQHTFNSPGEYVLRLEIFNGRHNTAKYIVLTAVDKHPDPCFPDVMIVNGGWNVTSGPRFKRGDAVVIESSVISRAECYAQYDISYKWEVFQLSQVQPIPTCCALGTEEDPDLKDDDKRLFKTNDERDCYAFTTSCTCTGDDTTNCPVPQNVCNLPEDSVQSSWLRMPPRSLPYGSFMDQLTVTFQPNNGNQSLINVDRGWFRIEPSGLVVYMEGGPKRVVLSNTQLSFQAFISDPDTTPGEVNNGYSCKRSGDSHARPDPEEYPRLTTHWLGRQGAGKEFPPVGPMEDNTDQGCSLERDDCVTRFTEWQDRTSAEIGATFQANKLYHIRAVASVRRIGEDQKSSTYGTLNRMLLKDGSIDTGSHSSGSGTQVIDVKPEGYPTVEIVCQEEAFCSSVVNPADRFVRMARCNPPCKVQPTFLWSISAENMNEAEYLGGSRNRSSDAPVTWLTDTEFGPEHPVLVIGAGVLQPGVSYRFEVSAKTSDEATSSTELLVRVNAPPTDGVCELYPPEGIELDTLFHVTCNGFVDSDMPLLYRFYYKSGNEKAAQRENSEDEGILLQYNLLPAMHPTILSRGSEKNDYNGMLSILIVDSLGSYAVRKLPVRVKPQNLPDHQRLLALSELVHESGLLKSASDSKDAQATAAAVASIAMDLNNLTSVDRQATAAKRALRSKMISELKALPVHGTNAVQQISSTIAQTIGNGTEMDSSSQSEAAEILKQLGNSFTDTEIVERKEGQEVMLESAGYLFQGVSRLLATYKDQSKSYGSDGLLRSADSGDKEIPAEDFPATLHNVLTFAGRSKAPSEKPTKFTTEDMVFEVGREAPENITAYVNAALKEYVAIPDLDLEERKDRKDVEVQLIYSENTLYPEAKTNFSLGNTPNLDLQFLETIDKGGKNEESALDPVLSSPVLITLPRLSAVFGPMGREAKCTGFSEEITSVMGRLRFGSASLLTFQPMRTKARTVLALTYRPTGPDPEGNFTWTIAMPPQLYTSLNITVLRVDVDPNRTLLVWIKLQETPVPLHVLVTESEKPVLEKFRNHSDLGVIPAFEDDVMHEFAFPCAKSRNSSATTYYVSVVAGDLEAYTDPGVEKTTDDTGYAMEDRHNVSFFVEAIAATCVYWDKAQRTWLTDGCQVSLNSTPNALICECTHLTVFGGEYFVKPHIIDPIRDAELFLTFFENPVVVSVVVLIWILYFAVLYYVRKLDAQEEASHGIHPVGAIDAFSRYYYIVTIFTGLRARASTTAKVGILIQGDLDNSGPRILNENPAYQFFRTGGEDSFLVSCSGPLGNLVALSIWHNGEGLDSSWYVDDVLVRDMETGKTFCFVVNRWLAADKDDRRLSVEIPVASYAELRGFPYRFSALIGRGLRDGHLWLSVVFRPPRSRFTRSQRVTCLLFLLLTTMVASFMFYYPVRTQQEQRSSAEYQFSWYQVTTGILQALIVVPPNLAVAYLFANARLKNEGMEIKQTEIPPSHYTPRADYRVMRAGMSRVLSFIASGSVFYSETRLLDDSPEIIEYIRYRLPYWCTYIAWFISIFGSLITSFFVMLYGLHYGRTASLEWIMSFAISTFQSIALEQPIKVTLVSILVALFFKTKIVKDSVGVVKESDFAASSAFKDLSDTDVPPAQAWLVPIRLLGMLSARLFEWMTDSFFILTFVVCTSGFVHITFPDGGHMETKFFNDEFGVSGPVMRYRRNVWPQLKHYAEKGFNLTNLHNHTDTAGDATWMPEKLHVIFGIPHVVQVRTRTRFCGVHSVPKAFGMNCFPAYDDVPPEDRNYTSGWVDLLKPETVNGTSPDKATGSQYGDLTEEVESAPTMQEDILDEKLIHLPSLDNISALSSLLQESSWKYSTQSVADARAREGRLTTYEAGGYHIPLVRNITANDMILEEYRKKGWADYLTRAIFLPFSFYNPNTNLLTVFTFTFEFDQSGIVISETSTFVTRIVIRSSKRQQLMVTFGVLSVFFLVFFMYSLIRRIMYNRETFFTNFWNLYDILVVLITITVFSLLSEAMVLKNSAVDQMMSSSHHRDIAEIKHVTPVETKFFRMSGILIFMCTLKLLKALRVGKSVMAFFFVLSSIWRPFFGFMVTLSFSLAPFVICGSLMFARTSQPTTGLGGGIVSMLRLMLSESSNHRYKQYSQTKDTLGPIYYVVAMMATCFVYANLLVALINSVYTMTLKLHKDEIEDQGLLGDFLVEKIFHFFGISVTKPVVDMSQFPPAIKLRQYTRIANSLLKRPRNITLDKWVDLVIGREMRNVVHATVEDLRDLHADEIPDMATRADYASNTQEWYHVDMLEKRNVRGPRTYPVNQVSVSAHAAMDEETNIADADLPKIRQLIKGNRSTYRDILENTRHELEVLMNEIGDFEP